ncbi:MAG: hypothetical protein ACM3PY_03045 [Omnitrophica WOR_2 bacterium]
MPDLHVYRFKTRPVVLYFVLAIVFSWSIYLPLVFLRQGWFYAQIPYAIHYLASFGPALAAILVTALANGKEGLRELWSRITRWRVGWKWALFSIFSPVVIFAVCLPIVRLVKGEWPDLHLLGQANYLPYLGWAILPVWLITFGFGEEIGWRGFALPRL